MGIRDGIKELFSSKDDMDYPNNYEHRSYDRSGSIPVMEMVVPLCCENCERKVRDALEEMDGVKHVDTDRDSSRVIVTGFVDPVKALRRVKKVKPKSELHGDNTYINRTSHAIERIPSHESSGTHYVSSRMIRTSNDVDRYFDRYPERYPDRNSGLYVAPQLERVNSYGRRGGLNRLNSFGRVERYDSRRENALMPMDLQRDFYNVRRMPSIGRHRYHDAEYISMGDQFHPAIAETHYVSAYNQRPSSSIYRSQASFSKLPVTNPYYMKQVEHEYNY